MTVEDVAPVTNRVAGVARVGLAAIEAKAAIVASPTVVGGAALGTLAANEGYAGLKQIWTGEWENGFIADIAGERFELAVSILTPAALAARARLLQRAATQNLRRVSYPRTPFHPDTMASGPGLGQLPKEAFSLKPGLRLGSPLDSSMDYIYAVKADGSVVISPRYVTRGRQTVEVKHTDIVSQSEQGRIAGDLYFENGRWNIDNSSGRLGVTDSVPPVGINTPEELEQVSEAFRVWNINATPNFVD